MNTTVKTGALIMIMMTAVFGLGFKSDYAVWTKNSNGLMAAEFTTISVDPRNANIIMVGSRNAVYRSINSGHDYQVSLQLGGEHQNVNDIYFDPYQFNVVYVATNDGLYLSSNLGETWKKIYSDSEQAAQAVLSIEVDIHNIYLGTGKGLFVKAFNEQHWQLIGSFLEHQQIFELTQDRNFLYVVTLNELYQYEKNTKRIAKLFSIGLRGYKETGELDDSRLIKSINLNQGILTIATYQGMYVSFDQGQNWQRLPSDQVTFDQLTSIIGLNRHGTCMDDSINCLELIVGTHRGVYQLKLGKWTPIYKGMATNQVNDLTKDEGDNVYAVTDQGVFYLPTQSLPLLAEKSEFSNTEKRILSYQHIEQEFQNEPSIHDVHGLAIEYAEVHPTKIKDWRTLAKKRALMPQLDLGFDYGKDVSFSDSLWGSSSSGGTHYVGPDDKSSGNDFGFDISLSWDFADYIWSTDQTTIDSRAKLMVELREDILDQITRLYFERRRLQIELLSMSTSEAQHMMDKEMRIAELTALIDSLTGGEFSRKIQDNDMSQVINKE